MRTPELGSPELREPPPPHRSAARCIAIDDADYPAALRDLSNPPPVINVVGDLGMLTAPIVAVVSTRNATDYGVRVTRELCASLARAGACIASGMARGIDAAAHRAALAQNGRTVAVLGTGVDVAYPVGHRELHAVIGRRGLLVSEFPNGARANKGSFPRRNRILAALAELTIVVEAPLVSGALDTAKHALHLGRTLGAVPGPIDSPQSAGTNELLRDGSQIIASVADALALVGLTPPPRTRDPSFGDTEHLVLAELRRASADLDTLATRTRLPSRECLRAVTTLELAGAIECLMTGVIRLR
jgi:DNA processing protein